MKHKIVFLFLILKLANGLINPLHAQGTWTVLTHLAPNVNYGSMILLSDGTVLAKSAAIGCLGCGNVYNKLTPSLDSGYVNGTWTTTASMARERLYYSSQLLKDGRLYVAGGEYGTDGTHLGSHAEVYDPLTNIWTPTADPGMVISDANSEILEDGRVLQHFVTGSSQATKFYNPVTNSFSPADSTNGSANESAWLKLPDNSILFVDMGTKNSERYIPSLNQWVVDDTLPVFLYDTFGFEMGGAFLLPDGRGFFIGATGKTAFYTPSGTTAKGSWAQGPDITGGRGVPDGAAAMMIDGKILMAVSPIPTATNHLPSPTTFVVFNYVNNTYTDIPTPDNLSSSNPCYETNMLALPTGQILYTRFGSTSYYLYTPNAQPQSAWKPTINCITQMSATTYRITGTQFNGISQGANFGDDWQMSTNYPIVKIGYGPNIYYCRTFNWNSTGVQRGSKPDTTYFTLPAGAPINNLYNLYVNANGISSDPKLFVPTTFTSLASISITADYPDFCKGTNTTVNFTSSVSNAGTATYQWQLNGNNILGATASYYSSASLNNGDVIRCLMYSSFNLYAAGCNQFSSNAITIHVHDNTFAINTTVSPTTICKGASTFLSASKNYSTPAFTNGTGLGDYISQVRMSTAAIGTFFTNNSTASSSPYYTYYPAQESLYTGYESYLHIELGTTHPNNYIAAWIDFNQDKSFDPTERIMMVGPMNYNSIGQYFTIPATSVPGLTRLRIRVVNGNSNIDPNTTEGFGETEDYNINIIGGTGMVSSTIYGWSQTYSPTTPTTGSAVSSHPDYSQQYGVTAADAFGCYTSTFTSPVIVNNLNIVTNASPITICPGSSSTLTANVNSTYCQPTFTYGTTAGNYIASMGLFDFSTPYMPIQILDNNSGASSSPYYTLYPASGSTTGTLIAGHTYTFYFQSGTAGGSVTAFLDYDINGELNSGVEKLGAISVGPSATGSVTFTIPSWAKNGTTRLRITCCTLFNINSCQNLNYGEIEDYTVTISGGVNPTAPTFSWNPTTTPSTGSTVQVTPSASTNYIVTATDADGCSTTMNAAVLVHTPAPFVMNAASPSSICAGETTTLSVTPTTINYCQPVYASGTSGGDYIGNVDIPGTTLSNISNGSTISPYYTLYPQTGSTTATLTAGGSYSMHINVGSWNTNNDVAAWIDYDGDGTWFGPLEKIGEVDDLNAYSAGTIFFKVPTWAKNGNVRLRVREANVYQNLDPCSSLYAFGETEDYVITITGGVNPTTTTYAWSPTTSPTTGTSVSASPIAATTYTVTSTGNYGCTNTATTLVNMNTNANFFTNSAGICVGTPTTFDASANACSGNAFNGNGTSYGATILNSYALTTTNNITMEAWVKWNGTNGNNQFIFYNGNSIANGYGIFVNAANANKLSVKCGGVTILNSTATLTTGTWQHVAVTKSGVAGGTWRLFVDGTLYTLTSPNTTPIVTLTGGTYVGRSGASNEYFNGAIDEVRLWNIGISSFLIPAERVACITAPQANLVAYWKFNEAIGGTTICADASGGNRPVTLSNANARTISANYAWNYGDATTGNGISTSHTYPSAGNYTTTLTVTDITGCIASSVQSIYTNPCITNINLNLYIQGYYQGSGLMTTVLANQGVGSSLFNVDSVTVELHDVMPPYAMVQSTKGIMQAYGNISCIFPFSVSGNSYYIVVKHRNSIETWSKYPVYITPNTNYSFSSAASQAYGDNQIQLAPGLWAIYSGDINHDENIDLLDVSFLETDINNFEFGYQTTDINGDGNVDLLDAPYVENNINAFIFSAHP